MDGTALFFYEKETHAMKRISTLLPFNRTGGRAGQGYTE